MTLNSAVPMEKEVVQERSGRTTTFLKAIDGLLSV